MSKQKVVQVQQKCSEPKLPYDIDKASKEVFLVIRFRNEAAERIRTSLCRQIRVIQNYGGRVVGMTNEVSIYEDDSHRWPSRQGMLLMVFESETGAMQWLRSDEKFRNRDFPSPADELQIFMIPAKYFVVQDKDYLTFCLEEMYDVPSNAINSLQCEYVEPVARYMDTLGIAHGSAFTNDPHGVRCSFVKKNSIVVLHRFKSEEHFANFFNSQEFQQGMLMKRRSVCGAVVVSFTLNPDIHKISYAAC